MSSPFVDRPVDGHVTTFPVGEGLDRSALRDRLATDGVVHLTGAIDRGWLDLIETGIAEALAGASADVDIVQGDSDAGSFTFSSGAWQSVEAFRRVIFESSIADLVMQALNTATLNLFYDFLLIKQARSDSAATPWHQDHSYYPLDGVKVVNSWVALDDIPVETALRFMSGSHRDGKLYRAVDFDDPSRPYRHVRPELPLPPTDASAILAAPMTAGDMLIWTSHTVHAAPGNHLDHRRAAFSVNWAGDDVVYNGADSLETYRHPSLEIGAPITCDKFPRLRGARS